jgi:hypothetical protein
MAEWGRKEYSKKWPSRTPVWTWTAIAAVVSCLFFFGMLTLEYERSWTAAERLYLSDYLKSGARGKASATAAGKYTLLEAVVGKGQRACDGRRDRAGSGALDGRPGYRLTDEGVKDGIARLTWVTGYVQRPWAAPGDGRGRVRAIMTELGVLPASRSTLAGVLRAGAVRGGAEGPGAADDLEAWPEAARAGAGDDGGVQREAGQVEAADDCICRTGSRSSMKSRRGWTRPSIKP